MSPIGFRTFQTLKPSAGMKDSSYSNKQKVDESEGTVNWNVVRNNYLRHMCNRCTYILHLLLVRIWIFTDFVCIFCFNYRICCVMENTGIWLAYTRNKVTFMFAWQITLQLLSNVANNPPEGIQNNPQFSGTY